MLIKTAICMVESTYWLVNLTFWWELILDTITISNTMWNKKKRLMRNKKVTSGCCFSKDGTWPTSGPDFPSLTRTQPCTAHQESGLKVLTALGQHRKEKSLDFISQWAPGLYQPIKTQLIRPMTESGNYRSSHVIPRTEWFECSEEKLGI